MLLRTLVLLRQLGLEPVLEVLQNFIELFDKVVELMPGRGGKNFEKLVVDGEAELSGSTVDSIPDFLDLVAVGREVVLVGDHALGILIAQDEGEGLVCLHPVVGVSDYFCDLLLGQLVGQLVHSRLQVGLVVPDLQDVGDQRLLSV
jgi:hypothetical protein